MGSNLKASGGTVKKTGMVFGNLQRETFTRGSGNRIGNTGRVTTSIREVPSTTDISRIS
jgi:hypothetical protein